MKVCYLGRRGARHTPPPTEEGNVLELLWDNWDDYGYKTSFGTTCRIGDELVDIGPIRLLVADKEISYLALNSLLEAGWNGVFPPPESDYISVPQEITFYQLLKARLGLPETLGVARALHDASWLVRVADDDAARQLVQTEGFANSLQRERGSITAYIDGWKILEDLVLAVEDVRFTFQASSATLLKCS